MQSNEDFGAFLQRHTEITEEIQLHAEVFYWVAHRTTLMVIPPRSKSDDRLPGMPTSVRIAGVTNVRNWLMEHPAQVNSAFAIGGEFAGPALNGGKGLDNKGQIIVDPGLYANAAEWCDRMADVFVKATNNLIAAGPNANK